MALSGYRYFGRTLRPYLTRTEKRAFSYLILAILAIVVLGGFILRPTLKSVVKLLREAQEIRTTNVVFSRKIDDLEKAQEIYTSSAKNINLAKTYLPEDDKIHDFLSILAERGDQNNTQVLSVKQKDITSLEPGLLDLLLEVTVEGRFTDIENFIFDLEKLDRANTVQSVRMRTLYDKELSDVGLVKSEILIRVYWSPQSYLNE